MSNTDKATRAISHLDSSRYARAAGDHWSAENALEAARSLLLEIAGIEITDDEIIDIRDALVSASAVRALTVLESNILRDCDIALRVVRCKDETAKKARDRLIRYRSEGTTP